MERQILKILSFLLLVVAPEVSAYDILKQSNLGRWGIPPANYSGITPLGADSFAVVDDKSEVDGFYVFHIRMNLDNGAIEQVSRSALRGDFADLSSLVQRSQADCEDIAFVPSSNTLFINSENDQKVREYDLKGMRTGRELAIPDQFSKNRVQPGLGFEALSYNAVTHRFWLTTEAPLSADGGNSTGIVRMQSFTDSLMPARQWAYRMDHAELKPGRYYAFGVPAMLALDDGRLLVMERELTVPAGYLGASTKIKIYAVKPNREQSIDPATDVKQLSDDRILEKKLLCQFSTHLKPGRFNYGNYEGMCLGPKLTDGRQSLLLICDSQAGAGNAFYHLKDYLKVILLPSDFLDRSMRPM